MASKTSSRGNTKSKDAASQGTASHHDSTSSEVLTPSYMRELIDAIRSDVSNMRTEILTELRTSVTQLQTKISNNEKKIEETDSALTTLDATVTELRETVAALHADNLRLQARVDDQENRSRRQNIRVIGLPEKLEKGNPTAFLESVLTEVFGEDSFHRKPEVDRAHRTLRPLPSPSAPPRAMIARMHHYKTKELILKLSYERAGQLTFRGNKISFFPDLSADLARKRAEFNSVKKQLHQAGVKFSLMHPATLRFSFNGARMEFKSPKEASDFVISRVLSTATAISNTELKKKP